MAFFSAFFFLGGGGGGGRKLTKLGKIEGYLALGMGLHFSRNWTVQLSMFFQKNKAVSFIKSFFSEEILIE